MSDDIAERAFDDLDTIAQLSSVGIAATDLDEAKDVLREINDLATQWDDPSDTQ